MKESPKTNDNISLDTIKNNIINNIILASSIIGLIILYFSWNRDRILEYSFKDISLLINISFISTFILFYLFRKKISLEIKTIVVSLMFLFGGFKGIYQLGGMANSYILIAISIVMFQVVFKRKWIILYSVIVTLLLTLLSIGYITQHITLSYNCNDLIHSTSKWGSDIFVFVALGFVLFLCIGQFQEETRKILNLINIKNHDLNKINEQLSEEISKREIYEQEIKLNERKFRSLFESSNDGIILIDQEGRVIESNPVVHEITGYSKEDFKNILVFDLPEPHYREFIKERFENLLDGQLQSLIEITIKTKKGRVIPIEFSSNLIINEEDKLTVISTLRDISYRKELEDQKFNAVLEAEERERARFSRDLHDELGPLFSTIKLYIDSLKSMEDSPDKILILDKLNNIVKNGVKQLREVSHNLSPYLLQNKGLQNAIHIQLNRVEESSMFKTEFHYTDNGVEFKPNGNIEILVYRIFLELLNNSIKHSKASKIGVSINIVNDTLNFEFYDDGIGFNATEVTELKKGIGLNNIINRIRARNGHIEFKYVNNLMKINISIPL